jgi:chromate transporter
VSPLQEVAALFLRLGATGFGGPAAHVALMEDEVVRRRGWVTREELLDLLAATNLIPGPSATELAMHLGRVRAGWAGLVVGGLCFVLPAATITTLLAWLYLRSGALPEVGAVLRGIKPVMLAVILQALMGLGRSALRSWPLGAIAASAVAASLLGAHELLVLGAAGAVAVTLVRPAAAIFLAVPAVALPVVAATPFGLGLLFATFVKIGAILFGSGYVLLAYLRADLVERFGWLTEAQLLDAVAVGQVTPGPLLTTATFIGMLLGGVPGALVATAGIILPGFVLVALSGRLIPRLRRSPVAAAFLDGVTAASLALMAVVTAQLARAAVVDLPTAGLAVAAALLLLRFRVSTVWLIAGGAVLGVLLG